MSGHIRKLGCKLAFSALIGALALFLTGGLAGAEDQPSSKAILRSLTPPKSATRGLTMPTQDPAKMAKERAVLDKIRSHNTRSLSNADLNQLTSITDDKPNIDLEIKFEYNSDRISRSALVTVKELGKALTDPSMKGNTFVLAGHADATGSAEYNQDLSERRAASVKRWLMENYSIPDSHLVTVGYGSTHLKNKKDPTAAENRRVAIVNMDDSKAARK